MAVKWFPHDVYIKAVRGQGTEIKPVEKKPKKKKKKKEDEEK